MTDTITLDVYEATVTSALQLLNAMNDLWSQELGKANSDFKSDWWGTSSLGDAVTSYGNNCGFTIVNDSGGSGGNAYVTISASEISLESIGTVKIISGTELDNKIKLKVINGTDWLAGYLGEDYLQTIGTSNGIVTITLPSNQGTATITYDNIVVRGDRKGTYTVKFDKTLGINSSDLSRNFNDATNASIVHKMYNI